MEQDQISEFDAVCDIKCQFEWIEISSNFFNIAVYTPALLLAIVGYIGYRIFKKVRNNVH